MSSIEQYYLQQANGLPHFAGPSIQRGHGLGGIFSSLFRAIVPLFSKAAPVLKSAAKTAAKEAVRTGVNVVDDVLDGRNLQDAVANRSKEAATRVVRRGAARLKRLVDEPATIKRRHRHKRDIFSP